MLNSFPVCIAAGCVLGFLSGLGTGGGSLLILWLTMVLGMDQSIARSINLMFFIPSALIACLFRWRQGKLNLPRVLPAIIGGCISAAAFSLLAGLMDMIIFRKLFGTLLIFAGLRELFTKK